MIGVVNSTGKGVVIDCSTSPFKPCKQTCPDLGRISNCTGRPVFCWTTMARVRISWPVTRVPILIFTRSQPRSLLSIARSNSARSLMRPSLSRKKRIAQIWRCFRGFLTPTFGRRSTPVDPVRQDHIVQYPFEFSFGHHWPLENAWAQGSTRGR